MISKQSMTITVIVAIIAIGIAFYGGMKYAEAKAPASGTVAGAASGFSGTVRGMRGGGAASGGFVTGTVIAKDATSITVQLPAIPPSTTATGTTTQTGSEIVFYTTTTPVLKTTDGSTNDVTVGSTVSVMGTANSDGSITAQSIQIRPTPATQSASTPSQ